MLRDGTDRNDDDDDDTLIIRCVSSAPAFLHYTTLLTLVL